MTKITVIIGPTASGKSDISLKMATKMGGAIISADAFQIYKGFNIGTNTLSANDMQGICHFLINQRSPDQPYSVQNFIDDVQMITSDHIHTPYIICGGSAMYLKALLYGYRPLKRRPIDQRPEGSPRELWTTLQRIDPDLANKTPYQNKQRVQRYLELYDIYKVPPSTLFQSTPLNTDKYTVIGISIENTELKDRINRRVDTMLAKGLVDEVRELMKKYDEKTPGFQAIGYKETRQYLQGTITTQQMTDLIKKNTYQYARRQMTWFKAFDHVQWIQAT
jgi:tRNA dimethylallyltransferase